MENKQNNHNALAKGISVDDLPLSPRQRSILREAQNTMLVLTSRIEANSRIIMKLKEELRTNPTRIQLKEAQRQVKRWQNILRDATNRFNGMMEVYLSDVPGETLAEKYDNLEKQLEKGENR